MSEKRPRIPLWSEGCAQLVLLLAGVVAWTAALGLAATDKSTTTASLFVTAGLLLIAAAAFFDRVVSFGPDGLGLAQRTVEGLKAELPPPPPGMTAEQERAHLFGAIEGALEGSVDAAVRDYEVAAAVDAALLPWLEENRYGVPVSRPDAGVDIITSPTARGVAVVEVKAGGERGEVPTPERLRGGFLDARIAVDEDTDGQHPFHRYLATDMDVPTSLLDRYRRQGIGVLRVNPETAEVDVLAEPNNSREQ